jgi:hypothetical protein
LPQRAQRADGLSDMSPLTKSKVKSGKWKVTSFTFNLNAYFPLSTLCF